MRPFATFLSLFTLLFFLSPILCLSDGVSKGEPSETGTDFSIPQILPLEGEILSAGDFLVQSMAALDLRGYHKEALKGVAVVMATRLNTALKEGEDLKTIPRLTPEEAKSAWGDYWFSQYWPMLENAVKDTWGQTLSEEKPSLFPLSWGMTCQGVECPYDFTAEGFETEIEVSAEEVRRYFPAFRTLTVKKARTGRVESVTSGNAVLSGEQVAVAFSLPSLSFTATSEGDTVIFRCQGKGSGDGMSLYGANEAAKRGMGYEDILKTFYPEATLRR